MRNSRLRGEEIKIIVTGVVNNRAWHHYFVGELKASIAGEVTVTDGNNKRSFPWTARRTSEAEGVAVGQRRYLPHGGDDHWRSYLQAPSTVAGATSGTGMFLAAWLLGAVVSICGALVYAELASRHPDTGGEYAFLSRGWGNGVAFVFAWSRMTVIQTGAIAAVAFVFGDYASEMLRLGRRAPRCGPRSRSCC